MKPLYISYLNGAGGKALINCLHCSHNVLFNDLSILDKQTQYCKNLLSLEELDNIILNRLLETVPSTNDTRFWSEFEIHNLVRIRAGDNPDFDSLESSPRMKLPDIAIDYNGWLPLVTHVYNSWRFYNRTIGAGKTIILNPHVPFLDTAIRIKWRKTPNAPLPCLDLNQLTSWQTDVQQITADIVINNYDPLSDNFVNQVNEVANLLDISVRWDIAKVYLDAYKKYHFDKIKQLNLKSYYPAQ